MQYTTKCSRGKALAQLVAAMGLVVSLGVAAIGHADFLSQTITARSRAALASAIGNPDPALPHRLWHELGAGQQVAACYNGTRLERLAALDAALASFEAPFALLPILAALMGANDRQVASRATHAIDTILSREASLPQGFNEVVPGQAAQLISQLVPLVSDHRLDLDVRGVALQGIEHLMRRSSKTERTWLKGLLKDREVSIRHMALGVLTPPLDEQTLTLVASMSVEDPDPLARGQAAAILCENALAHNVKKPSDDLAKILKAAIQDTTMEVSALGAILSCLKRFEGSEQADLLDLILAHPDPAIKEFWKATGGK